MQEPVAADRPHILIKGAPLKDASLHRLVEEAGGYVVAEDDWRGSRAAGDTDVCVNKDPVTAIFEKYFYDEVSPRVHPVRASRRLVPARDRERARRWRLVLYPAGG